MNNEQEKTCRNCKYHYKYYEIRKAALALVDGYCTNSHYGHKKSKEVISWNSCCQFWESNEEKKSAYREDAKQAITKIEKMLKDILLILNCKD